MEADHVRFVRREFPEAADRTATHTASLCGSPRRPPALGERVAALKLADVSLSDQEDVIDPAGGEEADYAACVAELWVLCQQLITLL